MVSLDLLLVNTSESTKILTLIGLRAVHVQGKVLLATLPVIVLGCFFLRMMKRENDISLALWRVDAVVGIYLHPNRVRLGNSEAEFDPDRRVVLRRYCTGF